MTSKEHHIISLQTYILVFASLLFLTIITVIASWIDLGSMNIVIALLIALIKSSLVLLFFMHLYYDNKLNAAFLIGSFIFLGLFIGLTMIDTNRREDIYKIEGKLIKPADIYLNKEEKSIENYKKDEDGHH